MKMIHAVVSREDANNVSKALNEKGFFVTKMPTTGGFLLSGNITLMMCTDDEKVDGAIDIIREYSKQRKAIVPSTATYGIGVTTAYPLEVTIGGATVIVTNVERFEKL